MGGRKTSTQQRQRGSGRVSYRTHQQVVGACASDIPSGGEEWWLSADPLTESEDDMPLGRKADIYGDKYNTFTMWGSQPVATPSVPIMNSGGAAATGLGSSPAAAGISMSLAALHPSLHSHGHAHAHAHGHAQLALGALGASPPGPLYPHHNFLAQVAQQQQAGPDSAHALGLGLGGGGGVGVEANAGLGGIGIGIGVGVGGLHHSHGSHGSPAVESRVLAHMQHMEQRMDALERDNAALRTQLLQQSQSQPRHMQQQQQQQQQGDAFVKPNLSAASPAFAPKTEQEANGPDRGVPSKGAGAGASGSTPPTTTITTTTATATAITFAGVPEAELSKILERLSTLEGRQGSVQKKITAMDQIMGPSVAAWQRSLANARLRLADNPLHVPTSSSSSNNNNQTHGNSSVAGGGVSVSSALPRSPRATNRQENNISGYNSAATTNAATTTTVSGSSNNGSP